VTLIVVIGLLAVWLFIALVCVGLCVSAARGDRGLTAPPAIRMTAGARRFARARFHSAA
jgi:hypothetical protein